MQAFREMVKGWLGKSILALIVLLLAVTGVEMYFAGGGKDVAAKVNGTEILQPQVDELVERQRQQLLAQENADPSSLDMTRLRKDVLGGIISRELLVQQASKDGYLVSDATVYKLIREVPAFQENGRFSQERYEQVLRQNGENPVAYPAKAKRELSYSLLIAGLSQSGFVTSNEVERLSILDNQRRDVHIAIVPAARYLAGITVSDDEVKKFYEANPARFTTRETVALEYISLKRDDFLAAATPSEDDLKERFEEKVKANAANEQRQAQHILITVDAKTKDADALKKVQDIEKRARAGEDFAALAKEFSQDPGSVATGGDLGYAGRGQFVPEFEKVLFDLKAGEISAPVKTQYGYHLIKLNAVQKPDALDYAALRPQLLSEARESAADELFAEQVDKLDAAVYESADLKEPAEKFGRPILNTMPFTQEGDTVGLAADSKVVATAFSDELLRDGRNSPHQQLADGSVVWIRVASHSPARLMPLAEVTADVRNGLLVDRAREKAKAVADSAIKSLSEGKTLAAVAGEAGLQWQDFAAASRRTPIPVPDAVQMAYRLPRPAEGKISADSFAQGASWVLVAVSKVEEGKSTLDGQINQLRNAMSENRSQLEFQDYTRSLREGGKVVVNARSSQSQD